MLVDCVNLSGWLHTWAEMSQDTWEYHMCAFLKWLKIRRACKSGLCPGLNGMLAAVSEAICLSACSCFRWQSRAWCHIIVLPQRSDTSSPLQQSPVRPQELSQKEGDINLEIKARMLLSRQICWICVRLCTGLQFAGFWVCGISFIILSVSFQAKQEHKILNDFSCSPDRCRGEITF